MDLTHRHLIYVLVTAAVGASTYLAPPAARGRSAEQPVAVMARVCHNHAGRVEGDGEYTDGAMLSAHGISCRRAFALVKPKYPWIYANWRHAYKHGFRLGAFRCRITPDGPNDLKSCTDGKRRFTFI
jgi:hypothetical protein